MRLYNESYYHIVRPLLVFGQIAGMPNQNKGVEVLEYFQHQGWLIVIPQDKTFLNAYLTCTGKKNFLEPKLFNDIFNGYSESMKAHIKDCLTEVIPKITVADLANHSDMTFEFSFGKSNVIWEAASWPQNGEGNSVLVERFKQIPKTEKNKWGIRLTRQYVSPNKLVKIWP